MLRHTALPALPPCMLLVNQGTLLFQALPSDRKGWTRFYVWCAEALAFRKQNKTNSSFLCCSQIMGCLFILSQSFGRGRHRPVLMSRRSVGSGQVLCRLLMFRRILRIIFLQLRNSKYYRLFVSIFYEIHLQHLTISTTTPTCVSLMLSKYLCRRLLESFVRCTP